MIAPKSLWRFYLEWGTATLVPGSTVHGTGFIENLSGQPLFIEELYMDPEWLPHGLVCPVHRHIPMEWPVGTGSFLGTFSLEIPANVVGKQRLAVGLHTYGLERSHGYESWHDYGLITCQPASVLAITPTPVCRAFISRSIWEQDKPLLDPIVSRIAEWGFDCRTVGINVRAYDPQRPTPEILTEIQAADCLVAIATPRDPLVNQGLWTAPEWLHGEVGIGFGKEKPILVLHDERVRLGGLPAQFYHTSFDAWNLHALMPKLDAIMPLVRDWVQKKQSNEFWENLLKVAVIGAIGVAVFQSGVEHGRHDSD